MQVTKTTSHLILPRPLDKLDHLSPVAITVVLFCLLLTVGTIGRVTSRANVAAVPTPALPVIVIATPVPAVPLVAPAAAAPPLVSYQPPPARYVVAFAAPDGAVLGPIPEPLISALLGRWGDGWVATTWQGGQVWIRAADLGLNLPNLAPAIAPQQPAQTVYVSVPPAAPQAPAVEQPAYQTDNQPAGPPAPPEPQQPVAPREVVPVAAPPAAPTLVPAAVEQAAAPLPNDTEVERSWAVEQQRMENCVGGECYP